MPSGLFLMPEGHPCILTFKQSRMGSPPSPNSRGAPVGGLCQSPSSRGPAATCDGGSPALLPLGASTPDPTPLLGDLCPPPQDGTLKQSFLTAALMLVRALGRNAGAQSYEFSQVPELLECLTVSARPRAEEGLPEGASREAA